VTEAIADFIGPDASWKLFHAGVQPYCRRSTSGPLDLNGCSSRLPRSVTPEERP
jgi:hypothetical protein